MDASNEKPKGPLLASHVEPTAATHLSLLTFAFGLLIVSTATLRAVCRPRPPRGERRVVARPSVTEWCMGDVRSKA
jgi:hypothetical protein